jgi:hypothetical protein
MTYNRASLGCLVHALALTGSVWLVFVGGLAISDLTLRLLAAIWVMLLIAWPAWGFILWKAAERKVGRMLHTLIVGFLFICPTFILLIVIHGLRHQATW